MHPRPSRQFHWRWIFFINVPISILGIFLALRFMDNIREEEVPRLDTSGFVLSAIGLSVLMFGLSAITYAEIPDHRVSAATSMFATMQQLSLGVGVTAGAFALQASNYIQGHATYCGRRLLAGVSRPGTHRHVIGLLGFDPVSAGGSGDGGTLGEAGEGDGRRGAGRGVSAAAQPTSAKKTGRYGAVRSPRVRVCLISTTASPH